MGHCVQRVLLYYLFNSFADERKVKTGQQLFTSSLSNPNILRHGVMVSHSKHTGITHSSIDLLIIAVISGRSWSTYFFKIKVGSGSMSHDLFGDLIVISLISTSEVGRNISSIFPLNKITASMDILQVVFGVSEMILFLDVA